MKRTGFDDDVEEESNEEVILDACYFPYHISRPGVSPTRRQTERDELKYNCNKNIVFAEEENLHVLHVIDSSGTGRMGVVQISSRVVSENCRRLVFAIRGVLIGDSGQVRVKQEQFSASEFRQTLASAASLVHCERSAVRTVKQSLWHMKRWSKWRNSTTRIFSTCVKNW